MSKTGLVQRITSGETGLFPLAAGHSKEDKSLREEPDAVTPSPWSPFPAKQGQGHQTKRNKKLRAGAGENPNSGAGLTQDSESFATPQPPPLSPLDNKTRQGQDKADRVSPSELWSWKRRDPSWRATSGSTVGGQRRGRSGAALLLFDLHGLPATRELAKLAKRRARPIMSLSRSPPRPRGPVIKARGHSVMSEFFPLSKVDVTSSGTPPKISIRRIFFFLRSQ